MRSSKRIVGNGLHTLIILILTATLGFQIQSCNRNPLEGMIIAAQFPIEPTPGGDGTGVELVAVDPLHSEKDPVVLTEDFAGAVYPDISHDARILLFSGKKSASDPWQIWAMDLAKGSFTQVTDLPDDCNFPASLPDGSVVFSRTETHNEKNVTWLYRCNLDGSELTQLTFSEGGSWYTTVLQEGRLLFSQYRQDRTPTQRIYMVMLPDGSKAERYYQGPDGSTQTGRAYQAEDGYVYFLEYLGPGDTPLVRIKHSRPLHSREELTTGLPGNIAGFYPDGNSLIISYAPAPRHPYGLYRLEPGSGKEPIPVYIGEQNLGIPIFVKPKAERPRILPSVVDPEKKTGLLLSQDIHHSMLPVHAGLTGDTLASRIELLGEEGSLGLVEVKPDGSFYLNMEANKPFRIQTLNESGEVVRGPSDWIWLRPNERRGCVGCHADPELAPDNRVPMAVKEPPVVIASGSVDQ